MLIRVLLLLGLVLALMWWFGKGRRRDEREVPPPPAAPPAGAAGTPPPQAMVRCTHCGLHLPQADALAGPDGLPYCSQAHLLQGPGQEPPP